MTMQPGKSPPLPLSVLAKGIAWNVLAAFIWGGWMVVTGLGVQAGLNAYDVAAIRLTVAGLVLLPILLRDGLAFERLGWLGLTALVAGAGAPFVLVLVMGMTFAPVRHASALINGIVPIAVAILSYFIFRERPSKIRLIGLALILTGVFGFWTEGLTEKGFAIGHFFFFLGGFLWASFTVAARYGGLTPLHAAAIVSVVSVVLYMPLYAYWSDWSLLSTSPWILFAQVIYQGLLTGVLAIVAYVRGIALLGPSRAAAFVPLAPVLAMIMAIPALGDWPNQIDLVSITLVSAGVVLAAGVINRSTPA